MPDNVTAPAAGVAFATDEVGGAHWPYAKLAFGADNSAVPVADSDDARLPVKATVEGTVPVSGPLTDAQLRATALAVSFTGQSVGITGTVAISAASLPLPTGAATAAAQATGNASLGSIDGKFAALEGGRAPVAVQTLATTTREYGAGYRASVAATATTFAITGNLTLGATREVRIRASVACWVRFGTAGQDAQVPSANAAANSMPIDANAAEVLRIPAGATHISVIRDSADGAVTFTAVA